MAKVNIEVGQVVGNWKILDLVETNNKYNYTYKCKCMDCGNTRNFNKYYLAGENKLVCTRCAELERAKNNYNTFTKMFNEETNECKLPSLQEMDIHKGYKLECEKGHKFISSLLSFDGCVKCKSFSNNDKDIELMVYNKEQLKEHIINRLGSVLELEKDMPIGININNEVKVVYPELIFKKEKLFVELASKLDKSFVPAVHQDRSSYVYNLLVADRVREWFKTNGYIIWTVYSSNDLIKDIERFENTCVKVLSALEK